MTGRIGAKLGLVHVSVIGERPPARLHAIPRRLMNGAICKGDDAMQPRNVPAQADRVALVARHVIPFVTTPPA